MTANTDTPATQPVIAWRFYFVLAALLLLLGGLVVRAGYIQVYEKQFLQFQGDLRTVRTTELHAQRGDIYDRNGEPLAVSIPVQALWVDPKVFLEDPSIRNSHQWLRLCQIIGRKPADLYQSIAAKAGKRFEYIQRQLTPNQINRLHSIDIPGIDLLAESKRYYPTAEVTSHVLGFTNIDDVGQEGLEMAFNQWLSSQDGKRQIIRDRFGRAIDEPETLQAMQPGKPLYLTIDKKLQYAAYRELKQAVMTHQATSGSAVLLDIESGDILAMVNQPTFNPNDTEQRHSYRYRNRAMTDLVEPGSTVKPLVIAAALESGRYHMGDHIDTSPGHYTLGGRTVRDPVNYGEMDLTGIIRKSSNVGISRIALSLEDNEIINTLFKLGFGADSGTGFPGENTGKIAARRRWSEFEVATLSFGYGIMATPTQLARAYAILGSGGVHKPLALIKRDKAPSGQSVISESTARSVVSMMQSVTEEGGTALQAAIPGYTVAGKTGTARKAVRGGYGDDYVAIFVGVAPASAPRFSLVVMVDEPKGEKYYGGDVAAPVFSRVMHQALMEYNIAPDKAHHPEELAHSEVVLPESGGKL